MITTSSQQYDPWPKHVQDHYERIEAELGRLRVRLGAKSNESNDALGERIHHRLAEIGKPAASIDELVKGEGVRADLIKLVNLTDVLIPKGGDVRVYKHYWWIIYRDCVIFYNGNPQCNSNESMARRLADQLYHGVSVVQLPITYFYPNR